MNPARPANEVGGSAEDSGPDNVGTRLSSLSSIERRRAELYLRPVRSAVHASPILQKLCSTDYGGIITSSLINYAGAIFDIWY